MERGKREQQKEQTRQRILEVAYRKFAEKGIEATNTADIASEAKLSHGAIFVHFKTRQEIVLKVIDDFGVELSVHITKSVGHSRTPRSILLSFTKALTKFEAFYIELLLVLPKLPENVQGSLLLVQNGFAHYLLPAVKREMEEAKFKRLGESGIMNSWFALLHYYMTNRNWYAPNKSLLKKLGKKIVNEYLELLNINK